MNALTIYEGGKFEIMQRTAQAMVASGYFKDSRDVAQAVVKVMAGAELGIAPFAAMSGIHIVQGRPTLSSNLIATLVKNDPRYNYKVKACDDKQAVLVWYEDGEAVGESSFTMKEADGAGLTSKAVWKQYPSDMLFARALTRGARRFAPGIFGGSPVYTPEEVGLDVDENGGTVYEGSYTPVSIQANAEPDDDIIEGETAVTATSPRSAQEIRAAFATALPENDTTPASEAQLKYARASLSSVYNKDAGKAKVFLKYMFNLNTSSDLTGPMAAAIIDWIGATKENGYTPTQTAVSEAARLYNAAMADDGQAALFGEDE